MKKNILKVFPALLACFLNPAFSSSVFAQGTTSFTYQGQLHDNGTNASGVYTMIFKLFDSPGGNNQIGSGITSNATLFNGLFTMNLDFGAGSFNGSARWLDITISNAGVMQTLSPRVQVLPTPYALFAASAATVTNGAIGNTQLAGSAVNANNIASGQVVKSLNGLTDAVSLAAGANVTVTSNGNALQISSSVPNVQVFGHATNATFTVPTNVTRILVEMWGAGGGGGLASQTFGTVGGGGGSGAYAWNIFTVTPGEQFSVTAPEAAANDQNGGSASFSGNGISMTAGGGFAGTDAGPANGTGGNGGTSSGSLLAPTGSSGDNFGNGGGIWRGGGVQLSTGAFANGPGYGGGGSSSNAGKSGGLSLVIIYY